MRASDACACLRYYQVLPSVVHLLVHTYSIRNSSADASANQKCDTLSGSYSARVIIRGNYSTRKNPGGSKDIGLRSMCLMKGKPFLYTHVYRLYRQNGDKYNFRR